MRMGTCQLKGLCVQTRAYLLSISSKNPGEDSAQLVGLSLPLDLKRDSFTILLNYISLLGEGNGCRREGGEEVLLKEERRATEEITR